MISDIAGEPFSERRSKPVSGRLTISFGSDGNGFSSDIESESLEMLAYAGRRRRLKSLKGNALVFVTESFTKQLEFEAVNCDIRDSQKDFIIQ